MKDWLYQIWKGFWAWFHYLCERWSKHLHNILVGIAGGLVAIATLIGVLKGNEILTAINSLKEVTVRVEGGVSKVEGISESIKKDIVKLEEISQSVQTSSASSIKVQSELSGMISRVEKLGVNIQEIVDSLKSLHLKFDKLRSEWAKIAHEVLSKHTSSLSKLLDEYSIQESYGPPLASAGSGAQVQESALPKGIQNWRKSFKDDLKGIVENPGKFSLPEGVYLLPEDIPIILNNWSLDEKRNMQLLKETLRDTPR